MKQYVSVLLLALIVLSGVTGCITRHEPADRALRPGSYYVRTHGPGQVEFVERGTGGAYRTEPSENSYHLRRRAVQDPAPVPVVREEEVTHEIMRTPSPAPAPQAPDTSDIELPPNAKPGECYARVVEPPEYKTVTERVMVKEESERFEVIPAEYEWVEEKVLVKEESEELVVVPAEYDWVEEQVLVKPATSEMVEIPAEYDWIEEDVLVKAEHAEWKKGGGLIEDVDGATGEIMCLVTVPAEYKTVRKKMLVRPATTKEVTTPAEYETVRKKITVRPPRTEVKKIPAEYDTVRVKKVVTPERRERLVVPSEYNTIDKQVLVKAGRTTWRRVVCETNIRPEIVEDIQNALLSLGYDVGPVDGKLGPQTLFAIEQFQRDKMLAVGGLTYQTVNALGVEVR
ncbi:MAG: peptidoglycan-binding protein [Verrucomicrobia bacterium]|nr:peptidoglycan-binding protein [Verrucomicrobiota bacterium]